MAELVAGVDGCKGGWVAVLLLDGRLHGTRFIKGVESAFAELADVRTIAIDVPFGYGPRQADVLARKLVGGSSVFSIPEREWFERPFAKGGRISKQAHALSPRIRHVADVARHDNRFREVHPEVCFFAMNDLHRLKFGKKSAGGTFERLDLLRRHGINIEPGMLGQAAKVPLDDVLDAAASAWTAARKNPVSLPTPPEIRDGLAVAIWY